MTDISISKNGIYFRRTVALDNDIIEQSKKHYYNFVWDSFMYKCYGIKTTEKANKPFVLQTSLA